jgi:uncharacterized protein
MRSSTTSCAAKCASAHSRNLATQLRPYTRCLECNGVLVSTSAALAATIVPRRVASMQREFTRCNGCARIYWPGSHQPRLDAVVAAAKTPGEPR